MYIWGGVLMNFSIQHDLILTARIIFILSHHSSLLVISHGKSSRRQGADECNFLLVGSQNCVLEYMSVREESLRV